MSTELGEWGHLTDDVLLWTAVLWTGDERLAKAKCGEGRGIDTRSSSPLSSADTGCELLEVAPRTKPQGHVPELHFP